MNIKDRKSKASNYRYLAEMADSGYNPNTIGEFHKLCLPYLGEQFFPEKDSRIIDIGAGWGHCLIPLKLVGYSNLYAVDIDSSARTCLEIEDIDFFQVNIERERIPLEDSYVNVVISFHLIEHLVDPTNFMAESYRILKSGGIFIIVTPDWRKEYKVFWRDHTHVHPYDKESIARIARCFGFETLWLRSFGCLRGIGRSRLWKLWKTLMFTGSALILVARKPFN